MTIAEWAALDEDEPGELVDGRLEEEEVPDWMHEAVVTWLIGALRVWAATRGAFVGGSEIKYVLREGRGRKPDVSMFLPSGPPPPRRGPTRRPPDVLVEVVTPTPRDVRRDRIEKMADYATFGARWYWIVDPDARTFEVHELGADGRYAWAFGASAGRIDPVPGCPGLALDLDDLWGEVDRLGPPEGDREA
jgi:Uma2 family endonuclease